MGKRVRLFGLLLWKNFKIQQRKLVVTLIEILLPVLFALILIFIRVKVTAHDVQDGLTFTPFTVSELPYSLCPTRPACVRPLIYIMPWWLYYAPKNNFTDGVMQFVKNGLDRVDNVVGFSNESAMVDDLLTCLNRRPEFLGKNKPDIDNTCIVLGGIVFEDFPKAGEPVTKISYKIRLRYSWYGENFGDINDLISETQNLWKTNLMFPVFQAPGPRSNRTRFGGPPDYYQNGFLTLQAKVDRGIITVASSMANTGQTGNSSSARAPHSDEIGIPLHMQRFPYPPWKDDPFVTVLQQQFPLLLMLSFVFCALQITKDVVHEKERKIKETLKMLGVSNWLHWCAWFIKYAIFLLMTVAGITAMFCLPLSEQGSVVGYSDPSIIFLFLFVYAIATISFSFLVSVFFSKANSAAAAAGILFFLSYIPYFFLQPRYDQLTMPVKLGSCLISNVAMAYGGQVIGMFEGTGGGIQWHNIADGSSIDDPFSMLHVMGMLLLDAVLYFAIAWYVEAVFPGEYGVPLPFYFLFQKSYWCGSQPKDSDEFDELSPLLTGQDRSYFEAEPEGLAKGIHTERLRKVYKKGSRPAVRGMTLNMYEGQITALLGHNGAGKTTTISMLTGFIPATSGLAYVAGYDIRRDIDYVRDNLGLCPQHDVLFDSLTVTEHLYFFAKMKNVQASKIADEIEETLENVGLADKRNARSMTLSGGQKRKLSVGLALIGGSKVVILDEPTSGLDPNARRHIWDILNQHKEGRTIILTTHYMYEADILGDRIAIMAHGRVTCCGSPLFLKNKYGAGYNLVVVKSPACDVDALTQRIQAHIPTAQLQSAVSAELCYTLPYDTQAQFEPMFVDIENYMGELGINSFGVSVTTMEEVFIRVGELSDSVSEDSEPQTLQRNGGPDSALLSTPYDDLHPSQSNPSLNTRLLLAEEVGVEKYGGVLFYVTQLQGLFVKKMLHTYRNLILTVSQLLVPIVFTILALVVLRTMPGALDSPPLKLDMSHYGANTIVYNTTTTPDTLTALGRMYAKQFRHQRALHVKNSTARNMTVDEYLLDIGRKSLPSYNEDLNIAASFIPTKYHRAHIAAYFNNQAYHNSPISLAAAMNALFALVMDRDDVTIETTNHPLPRTEDQEASTEILQSFQGFTITFNLLFGISFLISSFALFPIRERATKAKHVQFVSGVHAGTFWLAAFVWDFLNYILPCAAILLVFVAFRVTAFIGGVRALYILLLFVMYGVAGLPFTYLASFICTVPSSGLVWLTMFNIIAGLGTVLAVDILNFPGLNLQHVANVLEWVFLTCIPGFCLGQGLNDLYENFEFLKICSDPMVSIACTFNISNPCCKDNCGDFCLHYTEEYLSWEQGGIGRYLAFLAVQSIVFFTVLLIIELQLPNKLWYRLCGSRKVLYVAAADGEEVAVAEDSDVALERQRIAATDLSVLQSLDSLLMCDLTKHYGGENVVAVDSLSLGIPRQECFGLLGVNGAGKTSTFKMLTGDEMITAGDAYLAGYSVKQDIGQVQSMLGYCPQYDALIDQLTGEETLYMFARLRGVKNIKHVVKTLLTDLLLTEHAHKLVKNFSGGNKRKLSAAIALVGSPPIILLDEPSCGMDPVARRQLWDVLDKARARGRTLVLTSHSMEECEALCTRLAIMVNGKLKCLGSTQHLKSKFGQGYTLMAKVPPHTLQPFMDMVSTTFPSSVLKDAHHGMLHYHITDTAVTWSQLFSVMERAKEKFELDDYSLSQTTLEQVFITFAQAQIPPIERTVTCMGRVTCGLC